LGTALGTKTIGIDFGKGSNDTCQLSRIKKDLAEKKFIGMVMQATDDVPGVSIALNGEEIFAQPSLAATLHRCNADILGKKRRIGNPISAVSSVTMKIKNGRMLAFGSGPHVLGVNAATSDTSESQIEAIKVVTLDRGVGLEFRLWGSGVEFLKGAIPIGIKISRFRIDPLVLPEFGKRFIESRHVGTSLNLWLI
jgi:hypothetical protein